MNDIKKKCNFKFVLLGDFEQLKPVEKTTYDVKNSEVFAELVDGPLLELTVNYRAINDPEYKYFLNDMMKVREGKTINFNKYGKTDGIKSISWTNKPEKHLTKNGILKKVKM